MLIYLASPYSHPDPAVRRERFEAVCREAALMIDGRLLVFSPIAHSHPVAIHGGLPETSWEYWQRWALMMLARCDKLVVLKLDGWEQSVGVRAEIEFAESVGKAVLYRTPVMATSFRAEKVPDDERRSDAT